MESYTVYTEEEYHKPATQQPITEEEPITQSDSLRMSVLRENNTLAM